MVLLSRNAPPLLRVVNQKEHATDNDHEQEEEEEGATDEKLDKDDDDDDDDIHREPESSDDNDEGNIYMTNWQRPRTGHKIRVPPRGMKVMDAAKKAPDTAPAKRPHETEDDADKRIFGTSSQDSKKRPKISKTFSKKSSSQMSSSSQKSSQNKPDSKNHFKRLDLAAPVQDAPKSRNNFKKPVGKDSSQSEPSSSGPIFRQPAGASKSNAPASTETSTNSQLHRLPPSSPLTDIEELDHISDIEDLCELNDLGGKIPCPICGERIEDEFRATFQRDHLRGGRRMNMRLQERFCKAHKARGAKNVWDGRGYPEIDWSTFHDRLKPHHDHLHAVLNGTFESPFRQELEKRQRSGKSKTVNESMNTGNYTALHAGYYGTKGEKLMAEHIVRTFSRKLNVLSGTDKIIASKGVSGGISGYVHAVLVPELALCLIMEDMKCDRDAALRIVTESSDLGELLNEEEDENMPPGASDDENVSGFRRSSIVLD